MYSVLLQSLYWKYDIMIICIIWYSPRWSCNKKSTIVLAFNYKISSLNRLKRVDNIQLQNASTKYSCSTSLLWMDIAWWHMHQNSFDSQTYPQSFLVNLCCSLVACSFSMRWTKLLEKLLMKLLENYSTHLWEGYQKEYTKTRDFGGFKAQKKRWTHSKRARAVSGNIQKVQGQCVIPKCVSQMYRNDIDTQWSPLTYTSMRGTERLRVVAGHLREAMEESEESSVSL